MSTPGQLRPDRVAALYVRADSVYKMPPGVDAWDASRDASQYDGPHPVVAHPPCRAWGQLKHFAKPREGEENLARIAVAQVRRWGGVLEHPRASRLWEDQGLPMPGKGLDAWGGFTLLVPQFWWGHRAEKLTHLYVCGLRPADVPAMPLQLGEAPCVVSSGSIKRGRSPRQGGKPGMSKANRERTPPKFAEWLV